jgi:hypothetical protein
MIRTRIVVFATTASIALAGSIAPAALAGSHWSPTKCSKTYLSWYKKHIGTSPQTTPKQSKEANAYVKKLEKQHHCVIRG